MSTVRTSVTTTIDRWLFPHIAGVINFSKHDALFGAQLRDWVETQYWTAGTLCGCAALPYTTPRNATHANEVADWLMHELDTHPEARQSRGLLAQWAMQYDSGIRETPDGVSIGAIDAMLLATGERNGGRLQIVVNEAWASDLSNVSYAESTHAAAEQLAAIELRRAAGKLTSLHPDTAEWSMGQSATKHYLASEQVLEEIIADAESAQYHHSCIHVGQAPVIVAVSPCVQDAFVERLIA